ncbi:isoleucine--tRNA ligase [Candidatus Azambacteria bacterium]|nr:isoleucine--tRNA ligase [Candidatus Azambacteria bacterium]
MELFNPKTEEKILEYWKREQIFEKSLKNRAKAKKFVFYEGPPSANGRPGIHHVLTRVYKDLICRYKTMAGFYVGRRAGWDTHGLPIELQVEQELKLKNKKDIEKYGVGKFNEKAKETVWKYKEEWDKLTERVGFWLDLKNPYITYEPHYIESLWHILSQVWKKKLLYKDFKVVPYCPRCGTALSSHEVAQGYEKVSENSIYVKFKLKPGQKLKTKGGDFATTGATYVLSWTTTPWTLPGNAALAAGAKVNYEILELDNGDIFIFAESLKDDINMEEPKKKSIFTAGKNLIGLKYEPLFDVSKNNSKNSHKIYNADFVNTKEGTGIVHIAPMYGVDDFNLGAKTGLPKYHTVDLEGKFIDDFGAGLKGLKVKSSEAENLIIDYLKRSGAFVKSKKYEHDYPFCWRCRSALLYYAKSSWFIRMEKLKKKLVANNKKINWIPSHIKNGRFGEWLNEIKDWAISRERYWGTPLPVWQCEKCKSERIVGSLGELDKFSAKKLKKGEHNWPYNNEGELDLHRPYVDDLVLKCQKCSGKMERIKDVIDVWFDSGAMPFAQAHQAAGGRRQAASDKFNYPADFISEAIDQTRGWFYTLHAVGALMGKGPAYKNVICLGHILDEKGEKMSKSRGNIVDPWEIIDKYGVDALRWYFFTINPPGESKRFTVRDVEDRLRRFVLTLSNVLVFYKTYAVKAASGKRQAASLLDKWILSRLNQTIKIVRCNLEKYEVTQAARPIDDFIDDLSRWWLRRSRKRFSGDDGESAAAVLKTVLEETAKLSAPFTPFLAEHIWRELDNKESVHLADYPKLNAKLINKKLEKQMNLAREIAAKGLALRAEAGIKVRQPLASLKFSISNFQFSKNEEILNLIKDEINVKEIVFDKNIKKDFELDTKITVELKEEGMIRELARQIQGMRKDGSLTPKDSIRIYFKIDDDALKRVVQKWQNILNAEVGAKMLEFAGNIKGGLLVDRHFKIENRNIWIGIVKVK